MSLRIINRMNSTLKSVYPHRQLGINQAGASKSMEKLSSGFRINRAGDDAAGLAISEKMRGQIRGLKQANRNAQDGISLIQTAEGALNTQHSILQRMRELAVQSSTDTNTDADRLEIQKEVNQLATELTRISTDTEFNTQTLLNGDYKAKVFHIGANKGQNVSLSIENMDANSLKVAGSGDGVASVETTAGNNTTIAAETGLVDGEQELDVVKLDNVSIGAGSTATTANYGLANEKGEIVAVSQDGKTYTLLTEATKAGDLATATPVATNGTVVFSEAVIDGKVSLTANVDTDGLTQGIADVKGTGSVDVSGLAAGSYSVIEPADATAVQAVKGLEDLGDDAAAQISHVLVNADNEAVAVSEDGEEWFAVSDIDFSADDNTDLAANLVADAEAIMTVAAALEDGEKVEIKADGGINVSDQKSADAAIKIIDDALVTVSAERSKLGAMQNRLEHTIANLGTSAENMQAAEARIRDLDMADEIMAFTKNNILQQAATAMLAQANMAPQSVLQLLGSHFSHP